MPAKKRKQEPSDEARKAIRTIVAHGVSSSSVSTVAQAAVAARQAALSRSTVQRELHHFMRHDVETVDVELEDPAEPFKLEFFNCGALIRTGIFIATGLRRKLTLTASFYFLLAAYRLLPLMMIYLPLAHFTTSSPTVS